MHATPESLLRDARDNDVAARGHLLELYRPYLTLLARAQLGQRLQGKVDPADLVQETYLEAHRNFGLFRGTSEGQLVGWLRQILAARLADLLRRYLGTQGRDVRLEREIADALDRSSVLLGNVLATAEPSPSEQVQQRERAVILAEALERLPEDYREALILRHFEELTFPQVAERMGRTVDSVEKLWIRGIVALRQLLEGTL